MKVLFIIPPYVLEENHKAVLPHKAMLPTGPLMVAAALRDRGHEIEAADMVFEKDWQTKLPQTAPDILLVSCHTARNIPVCTVVLEYLQRKWRGKPYTVLGGNIGVTLGQRDLQQLGLNVDAVLRGFAADDKVINRIERKKEGDIRTRTKYFDRLALPALDLLPENIHARYRQASANRYPLYAFATGCYWSCDYCSAKMGEPLVPRPWDHVLKEVSLAKQHGYKEIWCVDNLILTDWHRCSKFDSMLAQQEMQWSGMTRAEVISMLPQGALDGLCALREIAIGVESVNLETLSRLNRGPEGSYEAKNRKAFGRIRDSKIASNAFVILDLPNSDEADFWNLYEFMLHVRPGTVSWSFYNPPPSAIAAGRVKAADMGFYRWPLGYSQVPPQKIVQQAMLLSGQYWSGLTPKLTDLFWETAEEFGVNFLECSVLQKKIDRSPIGNLWEVWKERRTDEN